MLSATICCRSADFRRCICLQGANRQRTFGRETNQLFCVLTPASWPEASGAPAQRRASEQSGDGFVIAKGTRLGRPVNSSNQKRRQKRPYQSTSRSSRPACSSVFPRPSSSHKGGRSSRLRPTGKWAFREYMQRATRQRPGPARCDLCGHDENGPGRIHRERIP